MLESATPSGIGNMLLAVVVVMTAIVTCAGLAFYLKTKFNFAALSQRMNPNARLSIVESIDIDQKRKLILMRKDRTEHLILIGGQQDLIIESAGLAESANAANASSMKTEPNSLAFLSDYKIVAASNDESGLQSEPVEVVQALKNPAAAEIGNELAQPELSTPVKTSPSGINEAELTRLISDALEASTADRVNEQTVAKAVSMLNSEEEVTDFFDQARNRIFAKPRSAERPREDTDDFQAVLRNQKQAAVREQYRARVQKFQKPTPVPVVAPPTASAPAPRKFDPIPETAEEKIEKLKSLLGTNSRRLK